jgi:SAM-dependent methyltransferase
MSDRTVEGSLEKFDRLAAGYTEHDYADPARYVARRAEVVTRLGPPLEPGATILDLPCGDANMAEPLLALGYRYAGVDGSAAMIEEARRRLGERVPLDVALMDEYEPPGPVEMTLCLRAFYYAADRRGFFRRVAGYTRTKFVFDFDPRTYDRRELEDDLRASGFGELALVPFFLPLAVRVPRPVAGLLRGLERTGPLARAALRVRGIWFVAATPARERT